MVFLKEFFQKVNFEKNQQTTKKHKNYPVCNELTSCLSVSEGFKESAEKFRLETGIQPSIDLNELDDRIKIRDRIQNGCIEDAISLVNNLHPELLDNDRYLFFHLQVRMYVWQCKIRHTPDRKQSKGGMLIKQAIFCHDTLQSKIVSYAF